MSDTPDIHADDIRQVLVKRAEAFAEKHGCSLSTIGERAVRDGKFIANVRNGANFTVRTYQRVIDWIEEQERLAGEVAA